VRIFTIGHSTRQLEELLRLLKEHGIEVLADIRAFPTSTRFPHFNREVLSRRLPQAGITYRWRGKALGGYRRQSNPNSPHTALRSPGFRNYADYMDSPEFALGIEKLLKLAAKKRVAIMCAERLWWRCHRAFVSDYLSACCGVEVIHILDAGKTAPHRRHRAARLHAGKLVYDVVSAQQTLL